jgi:hypothetical protein
MSYFAKAYIRRPELSGVPSGEIHVECELQRAIRLRSRWLSFGLPKRWAPIDLRSHIDLHVFVGLLY